MGKKYEATPWFKPWAACTQGRLKMLQFWWEIKFIYRHSYAVWFQTLEIELMEIGSKNLKIYFKPWAAYTQGRLKILQLWWGIKKLLSANSHKILVKKLNKDWWRIIIKLAAKQRCQGKVPSAGCFVGGPG